MTEDQKWCTDKAKFCEERGAPTVAALLRDAATDPSKATICRQEMNRASRGVKAIKSKENVGRVDPADGFLSNLLRVRIPTPPFPIPREQQLPRIDLGPDWTRCFNNPDLRTRRKKGA